MRSLTITEQRLVDAAIAGEQVDVTTADEYDRGVRSAVVRDLLRGLHPGDGKAILVDPRGVRIVGAVFAECIDLDHIEATASLRLTRCQLPEGLSAHAMRAERCDLVIEACTAATTSGTTIYVEDAHLRHLRLSGTVTSPDGPALGGDGLVVDSNVYLAGTLTGAGTEGTVRLVGARVGGELNTTGVVIANGSGTALVADRLTVDNGLVLTGSFTGTGPLGTVRLGGADIKGQLRATDATVANGSGPGLRADGLTVGSGVYLAGSFTGAGGLGAVRLVGARISGQLVATGASVAALDGPGLVADRLVVDNSVHLAGSFTGAGPAGAVRLTGARISGQLAATDATVSNPDGPAVVARSLIVDRDVILAGLFTGAGSKGVIDLGSARIGGRLKVPTVTSADPAWNVDRTTYDGVPSIDGVHSTTAWTDLIAGATPTYAPQPYQQLASVLRAQGDDREARQVLIAQRRDQIHRGRLGLDQRLWARFTGWALGFGYKPWRTLWALGASIATALLLTVWVWPGAFQEPAVPQPEHAAATLYVDCPVSERVGLALDASLPLIKTPASGTCSADHSSAATAWRITAIGLQLLSWAAATLFVAGFTSAVRRP